MSSGSGSSSGGGSASGSTVGGSPSGGGSATTPAPTATQVPTAAVVPAAPTAEIARLRVNPVTHTVRFVLRTTAGTAAGFRCALVRRGSGGSGVTPRPRYAACRAVRVYRHLEAGRYVFYARVAGPPGTVPTTVRRAFSIP